MEGHRRACFVCLKGSPTKAAHRCRTANEVQNLRQISISSFPSETTIKAKAANIPNTSVEKPFVPPVVETSRLHRRPPGRPQRLPLQHRAGALHPEEPAPHDLHDQASHDRRLASPADSDSPQVSTALTPRPSTSATSPTVKDLRPVAPQCQQLAGCGIDAAPPDQCICAPRGPIRHLPRRLVGGG